jgi:hypothetical protein
MQNLMKKVELKKFSSVFLTLSLLMQVGIFLPIEVDAITKAEFFEESFGNGSSTATVSGWTETEANASYAKISTTDGMSNSNKRHLRLSKGAYVTKTISTVGYTDVELSYYWRGDAQAESSDKLRVFWKKSTDASFTEINVGNPPHNLNTNTASWSNKVVVQLPVEAWDTSIDLMFKGDTNSEDEEARVDEIKLLGLQNNILVGNMDTVCTSAGYDFGVAKYEWKNNGYQKESEKNGYTTTVTGTASQANWTSNPAVAGVISKQATLIIDHNQSGISGTINKGAHDISFVVLCGNNTPEPTTATIVTQKVVCESEEYLPNWGHGGADITSTTAQDYVDQSNGKCSLVEWDFEWAPNNTPNPGDNDLGQAGGVWTTFSGSVQVSPTERIWLREVMKDGYIPFSGWLKSGDNTPTEQDKISAEFYCNNDVLNYDNYEWIDILVAGQTYHCVGFNAPVEKPLICDPNVNLIKNGDFETPVVDTAEKWNTFASGFTGLEWLVKWLNPSQNAPETANLELHRGVNGWNTSGGENNYQYAELDTDYGAPPSNPGGSASVAIWQDIPTIPGKTYKLSFDFSPRPSTNASQNVLGYCGVEIR